MNVTCPKCSENIPCSLVTNESDGESLALTLEGESELFPADKVAKALTAFAGLMEGVAENVAAEDGSPPCKAFVQFIELVPNKITIRLRLIAPSEPPTHPISQAEGKGV